MNDQDRARLAEQVAQADHLVEKHLEGAHLDQSLTDLERLQSLIDLEVIAPESGGDLQALGAAFGQVLQKNVEGLDWVAVEDEDGRDMALRFRDTEMLFFPLTMIANRIEDGRLVDVVGLYEFVGDKLVEDLESPVE